MSEEKEEKREAKNAWINTHDGRAKFWATANELGLTKDETHNALNFVESAYDFTGDLDEALALIARYAELKTMMIEEVGKAAQSTALFTMAAQLPEAPVTIWTKFQKQPGSPTWSFTLRTGLPPEQADEATREALRQVVRVEKWMEENGYRPVYHGSEMAASPIPAPTQESGQETTQQQSTTTQQTTQNGTKEPGAQQFENIDRLSIRGSKTKPKIEFWRNGRQFAELYWNQGGKYLLEKAPALATIPVQEMLAGDEKKAHPGLTAEMLDDVGSDYAVSLKVYWVQSPKNPKWKDIAGAVAR